MSLESNLSGEFLQKKEVTSRLPLLIVLFVLALVYIYIGYAMQNMKQREKDLQNEYLNLHGTSVVIHEKKIKATDIDNIKSLIKKYNLNIITDKTNPIIISDDEKNQ